MIQLQLERMKRDYSQNKLAREAHVDVSYICNAEKRGFRLYKPQLERIAVVLGWEGDPSELLEEVEL